MFSNNELAALVEYLVLEIDLNPDHNEPDFAFSFRGQRVYCQRRPHCYKIEVGKERYELPR